MRQKSVRSVFALLSLGILLAAGVALWIHPARVAKAPEPVKLAQSGIVPAQVPAAPAPRSESRRRAPERERERFDNPGAAEAFRRLSLMDERGNIDPNGLVRAKLHVDSMRAEARRAASQRSSPDAAGINSTSWSWLGPGNIGGRIRAIAVDPTNTNTWIIGSAGGGIWKSSNAGGTWAPLDDFMANLAVTSLVMQPGTPTTIYAGTGEGFYNGDAMQGAGIFKSTDGGAKWSQLSSTANQGFNYVNRIGVTSSGIVLAATRAGVYRSADGGATFRQVQSITDGMGALDLLCHPTDSAKAVASGGSGNAYYTTDGGNTWSAATGFAVKGRVEVAYARSSPATVYAMADENDGTLYKSTNGGASYAKVSNSKHLSGQGWYGNAVWVDPTNPNVLIVGGLDLWRSTNGGVSWSQISDWRRMYYANPPDSPHADQHAIVSVPNFDGTTVKTVLFGNDGGIFSTSDPYSAGSDSLHTSGWTSQNHNLGITQFFGGAGNATSGTIVAGAQDNGTQRYTTAGGPQGYTMWNGGDGGYVAADPKDPNYFYGEYVYLQLCRSTDGAKTAGDIDAGITEARKPGYSNFIAPFILDPNNPNTLLAGAASLWRSTNVKAPTPTWSKIKSPADDVISAITVGQGKSELCWVGHNGGEVFKSTNCTAATPAWTRVDTNGVQLPERYITRIIIDPNDSNTVYVAMGGYSINNLWRTKDGGSTWSPVGGSGQSSLPAVPVRDLAIAPDNSKTLYAGSELGVFTSTDQGATWNVPQDGPANVSVEQLFWMGPKLVAVTHGRGIYVATPNASGGTCTAVNTGKAPTSAPAPDPLPTTAAGPQVRTTPTIAASMSSDQVPPGGVWTRKVKADGKGETWSYNFTIGDTPPKAGGSVPARRDGAQVVPAEAGSSNVAFAPRAKAASGNPQAAPSRGVREVVGKNQGPVAVATPRAPVTSGQDGASAPRSVAPPASSAPAGDETTLPAGSPNAASPGVLIQRRYVQATDPRQPASSGHEGWHEYWFDAPSEARGQREIAALNPSGRAGWVRVDRDAPGEELLRARGVPYRRVVPTPLAGARSAGSATTVEAGVPLARAGLASAFPLATATGDEAGVSAFDINFDELRLHSPASSVRYQLRLSHPHLDRVTVWLAAVDREVVLWDGRGGSDDGGFDDDAENDSNIRLDRVLNTELRGLPLSGHWTLYVSNTDSKAAGMLDEFSMLALPEPRRSRMDANTVVHPDAAATLDIAAQRAYLKTSAQGNGAEVPVPAPGQSVYFTLDWAITGTGGPVTVSNRTLLDGVVFCSGNSPNLAVSGYTSWCNDAWVATAGAHTLQWDLDYTNSIAETNENNNSAGATITPGGVDVAAIRAFLRTAPSGSGSEITAPAVGQAVYFSADWQITGTTDPVTVSRRAVLDGATYCTGNSSLAASNYTTWCNNAWTASAGSHVLQWDFDYTSQLAESNETNNSANAAFSTAGVDIAAQKAYFLTQKGAGDEVVSPLVGQTVYLTADWLVSGATGSVDVPQRAILDGATYCSFTGTVTKGNWFSWCNTGWVATAGNHTLEWDFDYNNVIAETNENNNTIVYKFSAAGGDLVANRAYLSTSGNGGTDVTSPVVGQAVYLSVDFTVAGTTGSIDVPIMATLDGSPICSGTLPESAGDHTVICSDPWPATAGTHTLEWDLNFDLSVTESDYTNNQAQAVFTTAGVDLTAQRAYLLTDRGEGTEVTAPTVGQTVYLTMDWSITGASATLEVPVQATLDNTPYCSGTLKVTTGTYTAWCPDGWVVTSGTHTIEFDVDYTNSIAELNENNNAAVKVFSDASLDLVAQRAYLRTLGGGAGVEVDPPAVGQAVYFTLDWQVNGAGNAVVVPQRAVIDGATFCSFSATVTPGSSYTSWCGDAWTATAGPHTLQWDLDYGNTLPDSNRNNNSTSKTFSGSTGVATLDVRAVRSYLRTDTGGGGNEISQPAAGQTVYFYLDWQVDGSGNAVAVGLRAMLDGAQYCTGSVTAAPLTKWTVVCPTGWAATTGTHTLRWDVDYASTIPETNEDNNSATTTFGTTATGSSLDLVAVRSYLQTLATGGVEVTTPTVGQSVYFFFDWQLTGTGTNVTVTERAKLDGVEFCTNNDAVGPGSWTSSCTKAWTATSGSHTLQWDLDYNNTVAETNENNNSAAVTFTPGETPAGVDLAALKSYLRTAAGGGGSEVDPPAMAQQVFPSLDWQVKGNASALNVTQRAVLDSSTLCSCSTAASVNAVYVSSCSQSWTVTAGAHTLRWDLDYGNAISEANKTNNSVTKNFTPPAAGAPGLAVVKTHTGNFTRGQNGATYSVTVSNVSGAGTSTGTVTVIDTLPSGLTLVSMAGTGWTCSTNACTRSDALAPGASYPKITVTVNVAANANSSVTNQVSVSGGGAAASEALDPTTIVTSSSGPNIANGGVINGASFLSPVAANGFVTIYGQNFSTTTALWDSAIPDGRTLPTQLGSVSVTINGKNAFVNFVSSGQLNVLGPPDTTVGPVPVVVTTPSGTASAVVSLDQVSPGFFAYNLRGKLYPSALFANTSVYVAAVGALSSVTSRPAKPGDIIQLYATGLGATKTPVPVGQVLATDYPIADLTQVKATIGGINAPVSYAGMTFAGVFQVNVQVPAGITTGDLPVVVTVGSKSTQPNTVLTFASQ